MRSLMGLQPKVGERRKKQRLALSNPLAPREAVQQALDETRLYSPEWERRVHEGANLAFITAVRIQDNGGQCIGR